VLFSLRNVAELPEWTRRCRMTKGRTIYETGDLRGRGTDEYQIDFASYPGGTADYVPREVIDELERERIIRRAFPGEPQINAWVLS
jgi:hypothetical protein